MKLTIIRHIEGAEHRAEMVAPDSPESIIETWNAMDEALRLAIPSDTDQGHPPAGLAEREALLGPTVVDRDDVGGVDLQSGADAHEPAPRT